MSVVPVETQVEPTPIWKRQRGESSKAYAAFVVYRDMSISRSLTKTARALERGTRMIKEWSVTHNWVERAEAYDTYLLDRISEEGDEALVQMRRDANERARELGKNMRTVAAARLAGGKLGRVTVAQIDPNLADFDDVARMAESGVKLERLALGLATEHVRGVHLVSTTEVLRVANELLAVTEPFVSPERHEALAHAWAKVLGGIGQQP